MRRTPIHSAGILRYRITGIGVFCALALASCRKGSDVSGGPEAQTSPSVSTPTDLPNPEIGQSGGGGPYSTTIPQAAPVPMPEALATPRSYFQTRSDIQLPVEIFDLQAGDQVELVQKSTGVNLASGQLPVGLAKQMGLGRAWYFLEQPEFSIGTASQSGDSLGFDLIIRLVPRNLCTAGKLNYGSNVIQLLLKNNVGQKESTRSLTLRDFPYGSVGSASFTTDERVQRSARYQGRATWITGPILRASKSELATGTIGILNR